MKYYSLDNILKTDSRYNLIIGERSNGKTYGVLEYAVKQYFQTGGQLAYVRRWKEDVTGKRASRVFSALIADDKIRKYSSGEYTGIYYLAGKFYPCNYDDKGKVVYSDSEILGYTFCLSDVEHDKSTAYPHITTILFDEFLTKYVYLEDEFVTFMNVLSTIIRQRDNVKIFMCGNTVNRYAPYFKEMGLTNIENMAQGSIEIYTYGGSDLRVAVEYCAPIEKKNKKSNVYFAFDNPKLKMITTGAWELNLYPHLPYKYKPSDVKFIFFMCFEDSIFQCEIIKQREIYFIYIHTKTTPIKDTDKSIIYTLENRPEINYNTSIYKPINSIEEKILWFFTHGRVYYQNNSVGDTINNLLNIMR